MTVSRSTLYQYLEQLTDQQLQQVAELVTRLISQGKFFPAPIPKYQDRSRFMRFAGVAADQTALLVELEQEVLSNRDLDRLIRVDL